MANLPATQTQSSDPLPVHESFVDALERGESPAQIAKRVHPEDRAARKRLRMQIWRMARQNENFQRAIYDRARINLLAGLPAATAALSRRAAKGRPDAIKLLFEASGFHNPRVQHEHSGDVNITVTIPRPSFDTDGAVTDAEVVEDT